MLAGSCRADVACGAPSARWPPFAATLQADDTRSTARAIQVDSNVSTSISPAGDYTLHMRQVPDALQQARRALFTTIREQEYKRA